MEGKGDWLDCFPFAVFRFPKIKAMGQIVLLLWPKTENRKPKTPGKNCDLKSRVLAI
jgi:hypothetical protein